MAKELIDHIADQMYLAECLTLGVTPNWRRGGYSTGCMYYKAMARAAISTIIEDFTKRDIVPFVNDLPSITEEDIRSSWKRTFNFSHEDKTDIQPPD